MSLTKGIVSLQVLVIVLVFLAWDTPRLLTSYYYWTGFILGIGPGLFWYICQGFRYEQGKKIADFINLFMGNISPAATQFKLFPQYYLIDILQFLVPWLVVIFVGLQLINPNLRWSWGKLLAVWIGIYVVWGLLLIGGENLYILPLFPAFALVAGKQLDLIRNLPSYVAYPRIWTQSFVLMSVLATFAGLYWGVRNYIDFYLPFICGSLAITFAVTAIAISQREKQFIPLLFWGLFVSLFLLIISPHWIWELKTIEAIEPIAQLF